MVQEIKAAGWLIVMQMVRCCLILPRWPSEVILDCLGASEHLRVQINACDQFKLKPLDTFYFYLGLWHDQLLFAIFMFCVIPEESGTSVVLHFFLTFSSLLSMLLRGPVLPSFWSQALKSIDLYLVSGSIRSQVALPSSQTSLVWPCSFPSEHDRRLSAASVSGGSGKHKVEHVLLITFLKG